MKIDAKPIIGVASAIPITGNKTCHDNGSIINPIISIIKYNGFPTAPTYKKKRVNGVNCADKNKSIKETML